MKTTKTQRILLIVICLFAALMCYMTGVNSSVIALIILGVFFEIGFLAGLLTSNK